MVAAFRERSHSTSRQHSLEPNFTELNVPENEININRSHSSKNLQPSAQVR